MIENNLIVSCQALSDEPLHSSFIMGRMAVAAKVGGASGIRANSVVDINEIKKNVDLPIIGIIKIDYDNSPIFITPTIKEVRELVTTNVDIIAIDATNRKRPDNISLKQFFKNIKNEFPNQLLMADCATIEECKFASDLGFDFVGTTLVGYTEESKNISISKDDFAYFKEIKKVVKTKLIAEGNIDTVSKVKRVIELGAYSVVVGSIITRPQLITKKFVEGMKLNISLLPLDERPCNIDYPKQIAQLNKHINLNIIEKTKLGNKKNPTPLKNIDEFLKNISSDVLILSTEMFLYGGLIPSRLHHYTFEQLKNRLNLIKELKLNNPKLKIYLFSCIMRTPKYNSGDEEPDYYEEYGEAIYRQKYLEDKKDLNDSEKLELENIFIPEEFVQDYANRRNINKQVNIEVINLLKESIIDYLIIPQDDSAPFGYTRIDQDEILKHLENIDSSLYSVHPGADEVACTMLARAYNDYYHKSEKIHVYYDNVEAKKYIPNYEDRPNEDSLKLHLKACGLESTSFDESDIVCIYNTPSTKDMGESFDQSNNPYKNRDFSKIIKIIKESLLRKKRVIIVDKAYSNGGELSFVKSLDEHNLLHLLSGYYAWNTNSNSLGTSLATGILNQTNDVNNIINHILEDCFYQSYVREYISSNYLQKYDLTYFDLKDKQKDIVELEKKLLIEKYNELNISKLFPISDLKLYHPWNRMFEIFVENK